MSSLLILGAGGHAKVVAETALESGVASSLAFLDDRFTALDSSASILGWPVMGPLAFVSAGRNRSSIRWGCRWPSAMPPPAFTGSNSSNLSIITCPCLRIRLRGFRLLLSWAQRQSFLLRQLCRPKCQSEWERSSIRVAASITRPSWSMACTYAPALAWQVRCKSAPAAGLALAPP